VSDPIAFGLAVLAVLVTPGPTNTLLASSGATTGFVRSLPLLLAEAVGYCASILGLGVFLAPIISAMPSVRPVLGIVVGIYLFVVASTLWRTGGGRSSAISWRDVFITTLFNPKAFVFAFAIIPWEVPNPTPYFIGFCAILAPVGVLWITFGAVVGELFFEGRTALVAKAASVALVAVGIAVISVSIGGVVWQQRENAAQ
jgi:threonine/homoserine/homoserine lactone efflux protein